MIALSMAFAQIGSPVAPAIPPNLLHLTTITAIHSQKKGAITISVNVENDAAIKGTENFAVTVDSQDLITRVEFYVGSELTDTQQSTPYHFTLDTIPQHDGPLTVKFIAYSDSGKKVEKVLHLTINNDKAAGAPAHITAGQADISNGKVDDAIREGRIALQIDKKSDDARFLLARAYLSKGDYARAQGFLEDVLANDPNNLAALNLESTVSLKQAFNTYDTGDKSTNVLQTISDALKTAVQRRKSYLDSLSDAATAKSATSIATMDALIKAGSLSLAASTLSQQFNTDETNTAVGNRLAYCQIKLGRFKQALTTLNELKTSGQGHFDAYSGALMGVMFAYGGETDKSDAAMSDALLNDPNNLGVRTAQAYIALVEGKLDISGQLVTALLNSNSGVSDVNYLAAAIENQLGKFSDGNKSFETAVLEEPLNFDAYIEQANAAIGSDFGEKKLDATTAQQTNDFAEVLFKTALLAKSDSYQALTGLCCLYIIENKIPDAVKYGEAAVRAQPNYAPADHALAEAYSLANRNTESGKVEDYAEKLDQNHLAGAGVQDAESTWIYFYKYGRSPVITSPSQN